MKNNYSSLIKLSLFLIVFIFSSLISFAQDCELPVASLPLTGNNISARINLAGDLFWDRETNDASFHTLNSEYPFKSTIFSHGLWVGSMDANGEVKVAAATYNNSFRFDYTAGPFSGNCENYDRLWEVFGFEIQQHISDFEDNGIIDNPIPNIMAYPAHQNPFFEIIHGFALPDTPQGLAPFFDNNTDGIYNPLDGDYPLPHNVAPNVIPAHIVWGISNDGNAFNSQAQSEPLNIEVQLTAWSLNCTDNLQINNTVFTSYKIINRGTESLDSTFVGFFTDGDLGCFTDDYFGCIPDMNTYYFYNEDPIDGTNGNSCDFNVPTYGDNPPIQAITFLNQSMSSFVYFNSWGDGPAGVSSPNQPDEFYHFMNGRWRDGTPLTVGGSGYYPGNPQPIETKFAFTDNPNDFMGWSMYTSNLPYGNRQTVSSTKIGDLQSGLGVTIDLGFTFYQDENLNNVESVNMVYDQTPNLQQLYDNQFLNVCDLNNEFCEEDCVWTGDANRDSIVNTCDFLQIGVAQGQSGIQRNKPLAWYPYEGENWNTTIGGIDLKHTDCSGDGIIDEVDFHLSELYYKNSYKTTPLIDTYDVGNELSLTTSSNFNLSSINVGEIGRCYIKQNQEIDLYGITFTLEYDTNYLAIDPNFGVALSSPWNSTISADSFFRFQNEDFENGNIESCYVKTDGINTISKNGNLGIAFFIPKSTDFAQVQTFIKLKNIKAILNDGSQIDYGANELEVNIFNPNGSGILLNDENFEKEKIEIFPNPTTHLLNVKLSKSSSAEFSIFDIYGKNVFQKKEENIKETVLPIDHLSNGIYFLKIKMNGKEFVQKFIKM